MTGRAALAPFGTALTVFQRTSRLPSRPQITQEVGCPRHLSHRSFGVCRAYRDGRQSCGERCYRCDRQGVEEERRVYAAELRHVPGRQDQSTKRAEIPGPVNRQGQGRQDGALQSLADTEEGRLTSRHHATRRRAPFLAAAAPRFPCVPAASSVSLVESHWRSLAFLGRSRGRNLTLRHPWRLSPSASAARLEPRRMVVALRSRRPCQLPEFLRTMGIARPR